MLDGDKREMLAERAESLLLCLKQRFPSLTQTTLDTSKIQCNEVHIYLFKDYFVPYHSVLFSYFPCKLVLKLIDHKLFRTLENPFLRAIQEFWRAWHLTLWLELMI